MNNNILVQYQGGGYSGCYWEWNFFYIDKDGQFHDIFSSGRAGIKDKSGLYVLDLSDDDVFTYSVTNKEDIKTFNKECNVVHITGILQWFEDNPQEDVEFFAVCSECGEDITACEEITLEQWHGCGGIMSTADVLLCQECHMNGTCGCCNEYVTQKELIYLDNEDKWNQGLERFENEYKNKAAISILEDGLSDVCIGCVDWRAEQIEQDDHKDLLFQSLATGKPDMFSDEMRWFWV